MQVAIPDQLMKIRQQIAALEAEEKALREILIADPSARLGADYIADVRDTVTHTVRGKDLKRENPALFAKLANVINVKRIFLVKRPEI